MGPHQTQPLPSLSSPLGGAAEPGGPPVRPQGARSASLPDARDTPPYPCPRSPQPEEPQPDARAPSDDPPPSQPASQSRQERPDRPEPQPSSLRSPSPPEHPTPRAPTSPASASPPSTSGPRAELEPQASGYPCCTPAPRRQCKLHQICTSASAKVQKRRCKCNSAVQKCRVFLGEIQDRKISGKGEEEGRKVWESWTADKCAGGRAQAPRPPKQGPPAAVEGVRGARRPLGRLAASWGGHASRLAPSTRLAAHHGRRRSDPHIEASCSAIREGDRPAHLSLPF